VLEVGAPRPPGRLVKTKAVREHGKGVFAAEPRRAHEATMTSTMSHPMRSLSAAPLLLALSATACATAGTTTPLDGGGADSSSGGSSGASSSGSGGNSSSSGAGSSGSSSGSGSTSGGSSGTSEAGGPEGGSVDASGGDGGCIGHAPAIQDDFESGSFGSQWKITDRDLNPFMGAQTVVTIDTTRAHSRTHAVKVTTSNGSGGLFGTTPPGQRFYGRAWVFMDADPGMGHWEGIVALGPARNDAGMTPAQLRLGGQFDILYMNDNQTDGYFLSNPNFFTDHMGPPPPVSKWVCEEFFFGDDTVRWWITDQGMPAASTPVIDIGPSSHWYQGQPPSPWAPIYASIVFGYGKFGSTDLNVWYDDVALDESRICCN
jgi:hypothetical protein